MAVFESRVFKPARSSLDADGGSQSRMGLGSISVKVAHLHRHTRQRPLEAARLNMKG